VRMLLVTVVGPQKRADLTVPGDAPIVELIPTLVELTANGESPAGGVWTVGATGKEAFPATRTLLDCGVVDGTILYLQAAQAGTSVAATDSADSHAPRAGMGSPEQRTRSVLPHRASRIDRLGAATSAFFGRTSVTGRTAPLPAGPLPTGSPSPATLTLQLAPSPLERARLTWRESEYRNRLMTAIAAPRLRKCVTIAVVSPKGGVGKTTISALLGTLLALARRDRIVAIDTNPDYGSLGRTLTPHHGIYVDDLLDVLGHPSLSVTQLDTSLGRGPHGLMVLPAPTDPSRMARLDEAAYTSVIRRLQDLVGVIVLDCGTGLQDPASRAAMATADEIVLISDAEPATASLVAEAARRLTEAQRPLFLVVNKMPAKGGRLNVQSLAEHVPNASGLVMVAAEPHASSRLARGEFNWSDAPHSWQIGIGELAVALIADWAALGLTLTDEMAA